MAAFIARMRELGYAEGQNLVNDIRWARGNSSLYAALVDELIALNPDILLGIQEAARIMAQKTSTIPIVMASSADPIGAGLVKSLGRPGTNVTGMAGLYDQLVAKQIELLSELLPKLSRLGFLASSSATTEAIRRATARAAAAKGLALVVHAAQDLEGVRNAFVEFRKERVDAIVIAPTGPMAFLAREIAAEALRLRVPSVSGLEFYAERGGLINYSPDLLQSFGKEIPTFVDRILKGAKAAELPVQQVTNYRLALNLKTAKGIGLAIPPAVALRADRVIE
jgi:putative tryptophan/tyrosine transport system substrate-binding protein